MNILSRSKSFTKRDGQVINYTELYIVLPAPFGEVVLEVKSADYRYKHLINDAILAVLREEETYN